MFSNHDRKQVVEVDRRVDKRNLVQLDRTLPRLWVQQAVEDRLGQQRHDPMAGPDDRHQHHRNGDAWRIRPRKAQHMKQFAHAGSWERRADVTSDNRPRMAASTSEAFTDRIQRGSSNA